VNGEELLVGEASELVGGCLKYERYNRWDVKKLSETLKRYGCVCVSLPWELQKSPANLLVHGSSRADSEVEILTENSCIDFCISC